MVSKNISIKATLYNRLENGKKPNESFSDVIERLLDLQDSQKDISQCVGLWEDVSNEMMEEMIQANQGMRKDFERRFQA